MALISQYRREHLGLDRAQVGSKRALTRVALLVFEKSAVPITGWKVRIWHLLFVRQWYGATCDPNFYLEYTMYLLNSHLIGRSKPMPWIYLSPIVMATLVWLICFHRRSLPRLRYLPKLWGQPPVSESAGASTALLWITPTGSDRDTREGSYQTGPDSYPSTDKESNEAQV